MAEIRSENEMKDSGIDAITSIPKEWNVRRIKYILRERNERVEDANPHDLLSVSEYYGVAPRAEKIKSDGTLMRAESLEGYKICKQNDLVVNIMLAWKGALGVSDYEGVVSPSYCVYSLACDEVEMKYLHYLFTTDSYKTYFRQHSTGIIESRLRLYSNALFSLWCILPPLAEQQAIADYLDDRCSKIDEIIAEATASIEEYKTLKQAVIFETVTKGLDKNVPMKYSGYEFIGYIPASWDICKVRHIGNPQNGISFAGGAYGEGYPFVSYGDVYRNYSLPKQVKGLIQSSDDDRKRYSVQKGDIFFTRTSETKEEIGFSSVCEETITNAVFAGFLIRVRPFNLNSQVFLSLHDFYGYT